MKKNTSSAHGKVILFGEHATLYGHEAIVLPVTKARVNITMTESESDEIESDFFNGPIDQCPPFFLPIVTLYDELKTHFNAKSHKLIIESSIPLSAGMGSSAAIAAALTKTFYAEHHEVLNDVELFNWIQKSEAIAHQKPSGVDAYAIIHQSALRFKKDAPLHKIQIKINGYLLIVDSKIKGSTKEAVQKIRNQLHLDKTKELLNQLGNLSKEAIIYIENKQLKLLGEAMNNAHQCLDQLGVSHPILNEMILLARLEGAVGAKLTGGGLGGCVICLIEDQNKLAHVIQVFESKGYLNHWTLDLEEDFQ
jgi:mevalonate kinase